jgi:hypothetical protein
MRMRFVLLAVTASFLVMGAAASTPSSTLSVAVMNIRHLYVLNVEKQ